MDKSGLLIACFVVFIYALFTKRITNTILTAPIVFLALGWGLAEASLVQRGTGEAIFHVLAEGTLIVLLFADAAMIDSRSLQSRYVWPERMLLLGLPLSILFGTGVVVLAFPDWSIWEAALLASILAPTDAALGQSVVTNNAVPKRMRQTLIVESGANDGLALPAVIFFACLAVGGVHEQVQIGLVPFIGQQIGLGVLVGSLVGWLGGKAILAANTSGLSERTVEGIAALALALISYLIALELGGNGFLAAFVAGLVFGRVVGPHGHVVREFLETEGQGLIIAVFLLIGGVLLPEALHHATLPMILFVLISLIIVRPLAIWFCLWRTDATSGVKLFLGWFGPRGLATVLFAIVVVGSFDALKRTEEILTIATLTVVISALMHGMTAAPAAKRFEDNVVKEDDAE